MSQPTHSHRDYGASPYPPAGNPYPAYSEPAAPAAPPPSHAGWAVAALLFFWPLAFSAFTHLHNIYPRWAMGDHAGAQEASDRVKSLGKISLWIFVGFFLFFFVVYGVIIASVLSSVNSGYR